eukprot:TRINITY_DN8676_c0_g1_i1.p1 TRINITY_DN8676_c0_g1~~TRINITY_DN8676_c0_g1_i1.p1  ORF type:complete len:327 (+),score=70.49 TRINITY_DN8676_c0_g1_i1:2-982(+)
MTEILDLETKALDFVRNNQPEDAIQCFTEIIEKSPNNHRAFYYRGMEKVKIGDNAGAEADFTSSINIEPSAKALEHRAEMRDLLGDDKGFLKDMSALLSDESLETEEKIKHLLWLAEWHDQKGNPRTAIDVLDTIISSAPTFIEPYKLRVTCRESIGDLAGAISDCDKIIDLADHDGDKSFGYIMRGDIYSLSDDQNRRAIDDYTNAIKYGGESDHLAYCYVKRSMLYATNPSTLIPALKDATKAYELDPIDDNLFVLGCLLFDNGHVKDAKAVFKTLLKNNPNNKEAQKALIECNSSSINWLKYIGIGTGILLITALHFPHRSPR